MTVERAADLTAHGDRSDVVSIQPHVTLPAWDA
jgi:hypothetical protein